MIAMMMNQAHIDRLVEETQKGNTKAFGELYDAYFSQIHKYVYYKVAAEHVDDLVGTIFIKAWTKIKKYRRTGFPFSSWLFRIAHNTLVDHYRTHKQYYELEEKITDESMDPQALLEKNLNGERVHQALRKIGKNYQEVILLKFMNDMSNDEIAQMLDTSESNVRTMQFRALKKLKAELQEQEQKAAATLQEKEVKRPVIQGFFRRIFVRPS
jgi:RNA polymerase sigma-70 factor (ECF subfamily)